MVTLNIFKKFFYFKYYLGAGKTTTINILTGLFSPTSGNAKIFGYTITEEIDKIQKIMGVCPQYDILWNELTGL